MYLALGKNKPAEEMLVERLNEAVSHYMFIVAFHHVNAAAILLTIIFNHKMQELFGYDISIQIKESKIQSLVVPQCMADMVFIED